MQDMALFGGAYSMLVGGSCHDIKPQHDASPTRRDALDLAAVFREKMGGRDHAQPNRAPRHGETVLLGHGRVDSDGLARRRVCLLVGADVGGTIVDERPPVAPAAALAVGRPTASH